MTARDRQLGMDADISRRDFLNGVRVAITDAASNAMMESAIEEVHRAVNELSHAN